MRTLLFPLLLITAVSFLHADEPGNTLLPNGDFESSGAGKTWASGKGATVEVEDGNHFLRLQSTEPNTQVQSHRKIKIPGGTQKVKVTFRVRYENIIPGAENWHVGSLVMHFRDSTGGIAKPDPKPFPFKGKSDGWVEKEVELTVPEGATELEFLPALFQVQQGTLDFDDFVVIPD
jgi:hypothetical protein